VDIGLSGAVSHSSEPRSGPGQRAPHLAGAARGARPVLKNDRQRELKRPAAQLVAFYEAFEVWRDESFAHL